MRRIRFVEPPEQYDLETVKATLAACEWDLDREEERMRGLDAKLTQLAGFSGVSIAITSGLGGTLLAADRLQPGFTIALGACLGAAGVLLLAAVVSSFRALAPKDYQGVEETALSERTSPNSFKRPPDHAIASFAATRRDVLLAARTINDRKAASAARVFVLVGLAFAALVAGLLVVAVAGVL